jgi:hypothetical protein
MPHCNSRRSRNFQDEAVDGAVVLTAPTDVAITLTVTVQVAVTLIGTVDFSVILTATTSIAIILTVTAYVAVAVTFTVTTEVTLTAAADVAVTLTVTSCAVASGQSRHLTTSRCLSAAVSSTPPLGFSLCVAADPRTVNFYISVTDVVAVSTASISI